jgi:hypothetical protein
MKYSINGHNFRGWLYYISTDGAVSLLDVGAICRKVTEVLPPALHVWNRAIPPRRGHGVSLIKIIESDLNYSYRVLDTRLLVIKSSVIANYLHTAEPPWEANSQLDKKSPACYGTRRFNTVFITAHRWLYSEPDEASQLPTLFLQDTF